MINRQGKKLKDENKEQVRKTNTLPGSRKRGEELIVKASDDSYEMVLHAMRINPELEQLGADLRKVRSTRTGDMIMELKRNPMASSSSNKEIGKAMVPYK